MGQLADIALQRVRATLPVFPGATPAQKLAAARLAARTSLLKYVPELRVDQEEARLVMSQVNAWVERNRTELEDALKSKAQTLPRWLVLNMGSSTQVQDWVVANYATAVQGLGPWLSGKIPQLVVDPRSDVSADWATVDAETRLNVLAMIVKMDTDGDLSYIFTGKKPATSGFGALPAIPVWAVVVVVIAFAAIVAYFFIESKRLSVNNQLMRDICEKAQAQGDTKTVQLCVEAARDVQMGPEKHIAEALGKVAMVGAVGFAAFKWGLPWLGEQWEKRRR